MDFTDFIDFIDFHRFSLISIDFHGFCWIFRIFIDFHRVWVLLSRRFQSEKMESGLVRSAARAVRGQTCGDRYGPQPRPEAPYPGPRRCVRALPWVGRPTRTFFLYIYTLTSSRRRRPSAGEDDPNCNGTSLPLRTVTGLSLRTLRGLPLRSVRELPVRTVRGGNFP